MQTGQKKKLQLKTEAVCSIQHVYKHSMFNISIEEFIFISYLFVSTVFADFHFI